MNARRERFLTSAGGALAVLALLAAVNVAGRYASWRLDFSEGRIYSLTPASKALLARVKDPVVAEVYFSPELPPQYAATRDYLENLLREYAAASRGRFRAEFVRAEDPAKFREQAMAAGIYPVRFNTLERERYEVREAFLGMTLRHLDQKEVLPFVQDPAGLEYDITSRIRKMTQDRKKTVAFVTSNGAMGPEDLPRGVKTRLEADYDVTTVDLDTATGPVRGVDALFLLGPVQRLGDAAVFALDQYLLSGGALAAALDVKRVEMRNFMASPLDLGLDGWLQARGVALRKNLVLDLQNQKVSISSQQGYMTITNIVDYPPFVLATDLEPGHPASKSVDSLTLPYAAAVDASTAPAGARPTVLVRSSRLSWMRASWDRQFASLNPFESLSPAPADAKGPFPLAVSVEGDFQSYFPEPPKASTAAAKTEFLKASKAPGRLAVLGSSRFIHPEFPLPETNGVFFLSLADWLAQDPELTAIRSKAAGFRPLQEVEPEVKAAARYAVFLAGPFFVIGLGGLRWRRLGAERRRRAEAYRP